MPVQTSTGVLMGIVKAVPATYDQAGFAALTFVNVGEVTDIPEYGPTVQVVTHEPLATGVTEKYKGFINYGSVSIGLGYDISDAGQYVLSEGTDGTGQFDEHSVSITYPSGDVDYFTCKVFSYTKNPGSANSIVASTAALEINTKVVVVTV
jgi:hypothetical protein